MMANPHIGRASEHLNIKLISLLTNMESLAQELMDEIGEPLDQRLTMEFKDSSDAAQLIDHDDSWTAAGQREARLLLLQAALWLAEQLKERGGRSLLKEQCGGADILTLYLNAKELKLLENGV